MDSDSLLFQGATSPITPDMTSNALGNVPGRCLTAMPVQPIIPWTPSRLLAAAIAWLMEETPMPPPAPISRLAQAKRRV